MKFLKFIFLFFFFSVSAQKILPFDSLKLKETQDFFADDYGNIYLYKNKDFSFTKYDSLGRQKGKLMLTLPFKIQSVQNPLNIPLFSENTQELKFYDRNLTEIQTISFSQKFGFISGVYAEDLQQIWLLDESMKRLIQYNFREDKIISSYAFDIGFEGIIDFMVFGNKVFLLRKGSFEAYGFKSEKIVEIPLENGRKLRRENGNILIAGKDNIRKFTGDSLEVIFEIENSQIVDKNSASYFVIKGNKLYLYKP